VFVFLPLFAAVSFGVTDRVASFMLLPLVTALAVGSPLFGRLLDRVGSRAIVLIGTLATTVGLVLAAISEGRLLAYHAGGVAMGLGLSALLGSAVGYILLNESVEAERTMAQGMGRLFKAAGRLAGGALIGAVVASSESPVEGYPRAFAVIALGMGAMHALSYGLKRRGAERG
jgi:MFS family permease